MILTNEKTGKKAYFSDPSFCDNGQIVFVEKGNRWRRAKVVAAHGNHGRVVNEKIGIDRLSHIGDMRVVKPFAAEDYLKELLWKPVKKKARRRCGSNLQIHSSSARIQDL